MALVACPFCRELFSREEAETCPHCDLAVVALGSLGPSAEALAEMPPLLPEDTPLPWFSGRAMRGPVWIGSVLGLGAFFAPWFELGHPNWVQLSGFDLARGNVPWLWGGAIGYFLILPLLLSRRRPYDLGRIRVITTTFALMTACEVVMMWLKPPLENAYFKSQLSELPAFYASLVLSLLTAGACVFLGRLPKPSVLVPQSPAVPPNAPRGETLH
jgi:hypothetical protein